MNELETTLIYQVNDYKCIKMKKRLTKYSYCTLLSYFLMAVFLNGTFPR